MNRKLLEKTTRDFTDAKQAIPPQPIGQKLALSAGLFKNRGDSSTLELNSLVKLPNPRSVAQTKSQNPSRGASPIPSQIQQPHIKLGNVLNPMPVSVDHL